MSDSKIPSDLGPKARSLLSMDSPFFDALWPLIFELADAETQDALHLVHPYFKRMWDRADVLHKSEAAQAEYRTVVEKRKYPEDCRLPFPSSSHTTSPATSKSSPSLNAASTAPDAPATFPDVPWYAFGAYKSGFGSLEGYHEFCVLADVDPSSGTRVDPDDDEEGYVFLSRTRDLTFTTLNDPLADQVFGAGYVHWFSCTGEREKVLKLEKWWMENGDSSEVERGTRYFDSLSQLPF
ncbi:hypothetical protein HGRIS_007180 [Hohenbuehelia grisea]|uniref:Uncharacterized protein n=1 Tax=Hohenbuehelia grisea TaxID=104357 RepID=A0ABR3JBA5_9AGAR